MAESGREAAQATLGGWDGKRVYVSVSDLQGLPYLVQYEGTLARIADPPGYAFVTPGGLAMHIVLENATTVALGQDPTGGRTVVLTQHEANNPARAVRRVLRISERGLPFLEIGARPGVERGA